MPPEPTSPPSSGAWAELIASAERWLNDHHHIVPHWELVNELYVALADAARLLAEACGTRDASIANTTEALRLLQQASPPAPSDWQPNIVGEWWTLFEPSDGTLRCRVCARVLDNGAMNHEDDCPFSDVARGWLEHAACCTHGTSCSVVYQMMRRLVVALPPAPAPLRHTHNFDETLLDGYMRCQCGARLWEPKADASPAKETDDA